MNIYKLQDYFIYKICACIALPYKHRRRICRLRDAGNLFRNRQRYSDTSIICKCALNIQRVYSVSEAKRLK